MIDKRVVMVLVAEFCNSVIIRMCHVENSTFKIVVNGRAINRVLVDDHVRKHKDITDDLILDLVKQLNGTDNLPDDINGDFQYFVNLLKSEGKQYRIVWLLEKAKLYIGVLIVYRDNRRRK